MRSSALLISIFNSSSQELVAQQTSADQEVISFLDARVRELERSNTELEAKTAKAESGLNKVKDERKKQLKVLEDMLQVGD